MIVGVFHFVSKSDLNPSPELDVMTPKSQQQIEEIVRRLVRFHPNKVMIEKPFGEDEYEKEYAQYRNGKFVLKANEIYQLGFRLARMAQNRSIYPVDAQGFPFDYETVEKYAKEHGQQSLLDQAQRNWKALGERTSQLTAKGELLPMLRFLNTAQAIHANAASYLYLDRVGGTKDYPGAQLVSTWHARNLHIFANMMRDINSPHDRVVLFIGQGHAELLRQCVQLSSDLELVEPDEYLGK